MLFSFFKEALIVLVTISDLEHSQRLGRLMYHYKVNVSMWCYIGYNGYSTKTAWAVEPHFHYAVLSA